MADRQVVIEAKEPLAPYLIDAGWLLLGAIDEQIPFSTALWYYWEPGNSWRLIITVPGVRQSGTKKFYVLTLELLQTVRYRRREEKAEADRAADWLMVVDEEDALARAIRRSIVAELGRAWFGQHISPRGSHHGRHIPDGYVYRFIATRQEALTAPTGADVDERRRDERHGSDN